ncbi:MAG: bifunctional adenosylcobinamide kinase/adenosylcobinamide-phosphate guanylyltransferase [Chloroflexi bacterium]|nr:bifunctional adenosylcobinamide kinase/adenosylcobinamide-phosphate guanylyltransferase [Chloroflexota bacterium]MDA1239508.1 bifunctional adenosylcobinamide kinase/adenosylcobinamide-phosphate guanylyltransferase [Chloroflexota bacterium]
MGHITFVTGGARSGKSSYAERLAARTGLTVTYIATMEAGDNELRARVARHRAQRPRGWHTVEAPRALAEAITGATPGDAVLVDCLSLWVANHLFGLGGDDPAPEAIDVLEQALTSATDEVIEVARSRPGPSIFVTNEVGSAIVPEYVLGRAYRDLLGRVNQQVSRAADTAWLLVAGRAIALPPPDEV